MFNEIISLENLFDAWSEFKLDKSRRKDVMEFEMNLEDHIFKLHEDLKCGNYRHGGYSAFFVTDPKRRHIHKASVRDRLVHHAVHRVVEPLWNRYFIFDSWSSRTGKGTHAAVRRLHYLGLKLSRNNSRTVWILKLDVKQFFASIDHEILMGFVRKFFYDIRVVELLREIVDSFRPGLPLGNVTSQLLANVYLDRLDQFVKHELKIVGYLRYADDFILMHPDRDYLIDCLRRVDAFLQARLRLRLHPDKIKLSTYFAGVDYLGYICFPSHRLLRTKTKRRMLRRICVENFASYSGVLKHCRSGALNARLGYLIASPQR